MVKKTYNGSTDVYGEMKDAELAETKNKLEEQRDALKVELRRLVAEIDKRILARKVSTMTDAEKDSLRQVLGAKK